MPICRWLGKVSSDISNPANWDIYPPSAGINTVIVIGHSRKFPEQIGAGDFWPTYGGENWPSSFLPSKIYINTSPYGSPEVGGGSASGIIIGREDNPLKLPLASQGIFIGGGRYVLGQPNWDMEGSEIYIQAVRDTGTPTNLQSIVIEGFADTSGGNLPPSGTTSNGCIVQIRGNPSRTSVRYSENLDIRHLETLGSDGATKDRNGPVKTFTAVDYRNDPFGSPVERIPDLPNPCATIGHLRRCTLTMDWQKNANGGNPVQADIDSKDSDIYIVADDYQMRNVPHFSDTTDFACLRFRCGRIQGEPSQQEPIFDPGDGEPNLTRIYVQSTKPLGTENSNMRIPELQIGNSHWYDGEAPKLYLQAGVTIGPYADSSPSFNSKGKGLMVQNAEVYFTEDIATNVIINEGSIFGGNRGGELANPRGTLIDASALPAGAFIIKEPSGIPFPGYRGVAFRKEGENSYIHVEPPYRANILIHGLTT